MRKKTEAKITNYLETFTFPDIPWQPYPVYSVSENGNLYNLKSILLPESGSVKKFTRGKQLKNRSQQAKMFDMLINIGFWDPLLVVREFPVIIQNHLRPKGLEGGYFLLDYYFPTLRLAIELDSDYHDAEKDKNRDEYLKLAGINTYRIRNLEKTTTQKKEFRELTAYMRGLKPLDNPTIFSFTDNVRIYKGL